MDILEPTLANGWATINGDVDNVTHAIKEIVDLRLRSTCGKIGDEYRTLVDLEIVEVGFPSKTATGNSRLSRLER